MSARETRHCVMWSGPRNISTAMMRAFENRPDTVVWDEPFYAAYLKATGLDHPMREAIIAAGPADWRAVADRLLGPAASTEKPGARYFYQKHMTHHMLPAFDRAWTAQVINGFLIREPDRVLASYVRKRADVTLEEIGLPQQVAIFEAVADRLGKAPLVLEARDVLANPRGAMEALCAAFDMPFMEAMLAWPPGRRASDGVWAPAWYDAVERSSGFAAPDPSPSPALPEHLGAIADSARHLYERLARHKLVP